jgi:poly(3-hydroxybutyrate) depolymerase
MNKPYRLFYISHWVNGTAEQMRDNNYYGVKPAVNAANDPAIFVAPQGLNKTWGEEAHPLFDTLTAYLEANLCIDVTRIIAVGFSMGGMVSYSLSTTKQKKIRAAIGMSPANYNIWLPATKGTDPIAWMQSTGMSDNTCPWVANEAQQRGSKFIAIEKAANNGCTAAEIPTWKSGAMVCYDYQGCKAGYPTRICTFNGGHGPIGGSDVWAFAKQF